MSVSFESGCLAVRSIVVGPLANNVYLLTCTASGASLLIDAADDSQAVLALIGETPPQTIVTTHRHADHWQALSAVVRVTGAETVAGHRDAEGIDVPTDRPVRTGDQIVVGQCTLDVIEIVGHTPGSIVLAYRGPDRTHLFTGDSLFPGGVGKTWSPADFATLIDEVEVKIFGRFDDETAFHPGHGDSSDLGTERPHLSAWRERGW